MIRLFLKIINISHDSQPSVISGWLRIHESGTKSVLNQWKHYRLSRNNGRQLEIHLQTKIKVDKINIYIYMYCTWTGWTSQYRTKSGRRQTWQIIINFNWGKKKHCPIELDQFSHVLFIVKTVLLLTRNTFNILNPFSSRLEMVFALGKCTLHRHPDCNCKARFIIWTDLSDSIFWK